MSEEKQGPPHGPSVHYNGKQVFLPQESMTGQELYKFFGVAQNHRLFLQTPGNDPDERIRNDATVYTVKNGSHFYDLPEGQFGAVLPRVEKELEDLKAVYGVENVHAIELSDGSLRIEILKVPVPPGWNKKEARILFHVPPAYPQARPDGFFTDRELLFASNNPPTNGAGEATLPPDNKPYRRFCWQPKAWDMSRETLTRYAKFCEDRLKELT